MVAISRNPPTSNQLQATKFQVLFPRISTVTYFCQRVNIPSLTADPVIQGTPFVDLPRPRDKVVYGSFDMEFILDEELWGWQVIHDWMRGYTFPCSFDEYKNMYRESLMTLKSSTPQYSDAYLQILSGLNVPKFKINFVNVFPVSLSEIDFDTTRDANVSMTAKVQFRYHLYNIERIVT